MEHFLQRSTCNLLVKLTAQILTMRLHIKLVFTCSPTRYFSTCLVQGMSVVKTIRGLLREARNGRQCQTIASQSHCSHLRVGLPMGLQMGLRAGLLVAVAMLVRFLVALLLALLVGLPVGLPVPVG